MKAKYIILSVLAACTAVLFGCTTEAITGSDLANFKVDNSYVAVDTLGGTSTINLTATEDWKVYAYVSYDYKDANNKTQTVDTLIVPGTSCNPRGISSAVESWVTVSPLEGNAGEAAISISAPANSVYRTQALRIVGDSGTLCVTVAQGEDITKTYKASEAVALVQAGKQSGSPVIVTGIVCKIDEISTSYGNATYYLSDDGSFTGSYNEDGSGDGNWLEVYRGYWLNGEKFTEGDELAVGDEVTIKAVLISYKGIPETNSGTAEVISIKKALLQILDGTDFSVGSAASSIELRALAKGDDFSFDSDSDWLTIGSVKTVDDTTRVKINVAENASADGRSGSIEFSSASGKTVSTIKINVVQAGLKGATPDNPYSVSEIIDALAAGTVGKDANVYIKGKVSAILYTFSASYGTGTFWISDDGTAYGVSDNKKSTSEPGKDFECYSVKWFGGEKWAEGNAQLEIGDEVIIYGQTTLYNGISETSGGNAYVYSVNDVKSDANGLGSASCPFNVAGAIDCIEARAAADEGTVFNDVCVKGKISAILYTFSASYGTGTFWISDDGTAYGVASNKKSTTEPSKDFECYSVYWYDNQKWKDGDTQIAVGDEVIVKGQLTKYGSTYETASQKAWIYSLNGATE